MKKKFHFLSDVILEKENIQSLSLDNKLLINHSVVSEELQQKINLNVSQKAIGCYPWDSC